MAQYDLFGGLATELQAVWWDTDTGVAYGVDPVQRCT